MKIALVLSGQLRHVEKGYEFIYKNLMEGYDVDTFIHAWHNPEKTGEKFSTWWAGVHHDGADKLALDIYKPKKHLIEPQKELDQKTYNADQYEGKYRVGATLSMFYSMKEANRLKKEYEEENNFKYDVVVRCRFDFGIFTKINYEKYEYKDFIHFIDNCSHERAMCMNDHFAFSKSEYMDVYSNTYDSIETIYYEQKAPFNPEIFLGRHVRKINRVPVLNVSVRSGIIRDSDADPNKMFTNIS